MRSNRAPTAPIKAAQLAAWLVALWPFSIYCGFHTQGEFLGALFVLAGLSASVLIREARLAYFLSGLAFGVALALKIDLAVAGLGFGLWQLARGRVRAAAWLVAGVLPAVLGLGLVDRLSWGIWFQSVLGHGKVNLVDGVGNQWGVGPWYLHIIYYFDLLGAPALFAVLALPSLWRRLPEGLRAGWFMNAFFVAVYAAIPHKEKRFLAPLLYSGMVMACATLAIATTRVKARHADLARALLAALLCVHAGANAVSYLAKRPWFDRIEAIVEAGRIPGIQKMLSPQWPATFYFPRHLPAEATETTRESLERATYGLKTVGVAFDRDDLPSIFRSLGFACQNTRPETQDVPPHVAPRAYKCSRH